jgi:hypothetical protein
VTRFDLRRAITASTPSPPSISGSAAGTGTAAVIGVSRNACASPSIVP